jgi:NAD(P)-dependent dehydrogenase (short-subunit alcohol dehydrogenase family)
MARIFITGSSTGLGLMTGIQLAERGHSVVLHARNDDRARDALAALPRAESVVVGDLETIAGSVAVADGVNALGRFDAVIHNAGIYSSGQRTTPDGLRALFAVNVLAPYLLTSLVRPPERLVYLSSEMHLGAKANLDDMQWQRRAWSDSMAYSESKLHVMLLAFAVARLWPDVKANGVDPGWVPTRMGGPSATDDLQEGFATQVELVAPAPDGPLVEVTGKYFHHVRSREPDPQTRDTALQDELLALCARTSGIELPIPAVRLPQNIGDQS